MAGAGLQRLDDQPLRFLQASVPKERVNLIAVPLALLDFGDRMEWSAGLP
jgi:hypothetical protein